MANQTTIVETDAVSERLAIYRVNDSGVPIAAAGGVSITLPDVVAAIPAGDSVSLGLLHYADSQSGTTKKVLCLLGTPTAEPSPASGGNGSNVWLGGGAGGALTMFIVTALNGSDLLTCRTWDGSAIGSTNVTVAKQHQVRPSTTTDYVDGVNLSCTYPSGSESFAGGGQLKDNHRTVSDGTNSQAQVVYPRYQTRLENPPFTMQAVIFATQPIGGTGISGVTWLEIAPARVWAKCYVQS